MKGMWAWIMQRLSAVILIVLVATHFGIMHFVDPTVEITFMDSQMRLKGFLYFLVDSGLLVLGLYHGLNGVRNVLLDYMPKAGKTLGWILTLIGVIWGGYGASALYTFLTLK